MQRWLRPRTPRPTATKINPQGAVGQAVSAAGHFCRHHRHHGYCAGRCSGRSDACGIETHRSAQEPRLSRRKAPQLPASRTARPARQTPRTATSDAGTIVPSVTPHDRSRGQAERRERHGGGREGRHVQAIPSRQRLPARQRAFGDRGCRPDVGQFFRQRPSGCRRDPDAATIRFDRHPPPRLNSPPPQPQAPRCP